MYVDDSGIFFPTIFIDESVDWLLKLALKTLLNTWISIHNSYGELHKE